MCNELSPVKCDLRDLRDFLHKKLYGLEAQLRLAKHGDKPIGGYEPPVLCKMDTGQLAMQIRQLDEMIRRVQSELEAIDTYRVDMTELGLIGAYHGYE